jgi:membrane fusion protein, multidrug efflux system
MKRILTIVAILAVIALVGFRLMNNKKQIDSKKQMPDTTGVQVSVNVAPVQSRISERNLTLVGTVIANKVIDIKTEVQGTLTNLTFELGDQVRQGQVLARVDAKVKSLAVSTAEQTLANAKQNVERYTNLFKGGAATEAQLQQYQLTYDNARNQLEQARKELSNTNVVAPISGIITQKPVEIGAFVNIGTSIGTVVDVSRLKVQLNVAERDVYALKLGDPVSLTTSVYPGVTFEGKITFISPRGDDAHNYPVEVQLVNQAKNQLKAGTYVDVAFNRKSQTPTLQIPREALVGSIKEAQVYVVATDNVVKLRKITVGADNGAWLEVLEGLKEGEKVVTTGQINLTDNARVAVIQ